MTDDEKSDYKMLSKAIRKEIADTTSTKEEDVNDMLSKFKQLENFHGWVHSKQKKKEPIPDNRDELMQVYQYERPNFLAPHIHKKTVSKE